MSYRVVTTACVILAMSSPPVVAQVTPPKDTGKNNDPVLSALGTQEAREATRRRRQGDAFVRSCAVDLAIEEYNASLGISNADADAHAGLASALALKKRYKEAIWQYRAALNMVPGQNWLSSRRTDGDIQMRFALLLSQLGRNQEAVAIYKDGLSFFQKNDYLLLPQDFDTQAFDKALFDASTQAFLGLRQKAYGNFDEASVTLREALRIKPNFAVGHLLLGMVLKLDEKYTEAKVELAKAKETEQGAVRQRAIEVLNSFN